MCPVSLLLALAIADGAIHMIDTAEDIARVRFSADRNSTVLHIKEDMRHVPVLREVECRFKLAPTKILTATKLCDQMTSLAARAGYKGRLTPYSIRRGHGNILDRTSPGALH